MIRHNWKREWPVELVYTCSPRDKSVTSRSSNCHGCGAKIRAQWPTAPYLLDVMWRDRSSGELMAELVEEASHD